MARVVRERVNGFWHTIVVDGSLPVPTVKVEAPKLLRRSGRPPWGGTSPLRQEILNALLGYRHGRTTRDISNEIERDNGHVQSVILTLIGMGLVVSCGSADEGKKPQLKWKLRNERKYRSRGPL